MREIVIDTETTGLDHKGGDRIIEVACVELKNHVQTGNNLQFYCNAEKKISEEAFKIHGLSNEFLKNHPTFKDQFKNFLQFIEDDKLIIHNSDFDMGFLNNELKLVGKKELQNEVVDTIKLARKVLNTRIANLDYLCKRFSIDLSKRNLHGALLDCQLLAEVYLELLGGRQTAMNLDNSKKNIEKNTNKLDDIDKKINKIELSEQDIQEHKKFISDLKNAMWHKVDY